MTRNTNENTQDAELQKELEGLKEKYTRLHEEKLRTEQDLANVKKQLDDLKKEAREAYGTDDPQELERVLADRRKENLRMVTEYREHIASIEKGLSALEEQADDHA